MTSKKDSSPAAFGDAKAVMDLALKNPDMMMEFTTGGKATHFKQRCNNFRNLMRDVAQELLANTPGVRGQTAYDILTIAQTDENGVSTPKGLFLKFKHIKVEGIIRDADGQELTLPTVPSLFSTD